MFANFFISLLVGVNIYNMFGIGFVCLLVGGYVLTLGMVSVLDFFYYKFKGIPWILSYKWADYWPYWELI